jgi:hypothetical protein
MGNAQNRVGGAKWLAGLVWRDAGGIYAARDRFRETTTRHALSAFRVVCYQHVVKLGRRV